ncbi:MAG TPA: hypothetical protein VK459_06955 [Polyangiaceae bacterium]|jgi:serine/threonine-protein kinase|nr:hypothetical protein [Polyangiaceae bacterium]
MELLGGFVGVAQDADTLALRPAIGWAVRDADASARQATATPEEPSQGPTALDSPRAKKYDVVVTGDGPKLPDIDSLAANTPDRISDLPADPGRNRPSDPARNRPSSPPQPRPSDPPGRQASPDAQSGVSTARRKGFLVTLDRARNIVRVKVWGFWTIDDAKAYWDEFKAKADMAAGKPWYVLADIADFSAQKPDVNVYVEKTMSYARTNGMVRAANLVSSALSKMQISRLSQETGLPSFSFFQSESDAIRWLLTPPDARL